MSKTQKTLIGILIFIFFVSVALLTNKPTPNTDVQPNVGWNTYTNSEHKFSIQYPNETELITDKISMGTLGYLPTCNTDSAFACIYFASSTYPHSNFSSAGISLNNVFDKKSKEECYALNPYEQSIGEDVIISGLPFKTFIAGDAAMSHQSSGTDFRIFHNNTCFEITTRINTTTFEVYEEGSIVRFTDTEKQELQSTMGKIVESFKFL